MLKVNAQAIIKGIPSNFDVQTFIKTIPNPDDTPQEAKTKIETSRKMLYNTVRTALENHQKANRLIPDYVFERAKAMGLEVPIMQGYGTTEKEPVIKDPLGLR